MGTWPIVTRGSLVDALTAGLTRTPPRAQLLRGPSGVGKTTLAAGVAAAIAARGRTIVPVVALAELREVPLGALAPLLASSSVAEHADIAVRLSELVALIGRHADSYLLVVDDAPLLDTASAAALYQLIRVFAVPALMTARDEHPLTGAVARLLHEDLVTVTELPGLSLDETRMVLRRHLGAEPRPESLQRLYGATAGNPLFLRELTLAAERSDRVHAGPYGIEIDLVRLPDHVLETVVARLADLSPDERRMAEFIALAQPWPPAATLPDEQGIVQDLLDTGVLAPAEPVGSGYLHLAHPVYAEALLSALGTDERAARRRAAAQRLLVLNEEPLRFTALCLLSDGGGQLDAADLVWAAEYAHLVGDHTRAVQAAGKALEAGPDSHAALIRASALSALGGEPNTIDEAFSQAASLADDADARARVEVRWGQHTALRDHDPARAAERAAALLPELGTAAALLAPDLAKWRLMAGDASALDTPLTPQADADSAVALSTAIGMAMMATMAGRVAEARQAVDAGRPLADRFAAVQPFAAGLLDLSTFLVHVAEGSIAEARAFAEEQRLQPFADSAGVWSYALALIHLHAGRLHDAVPLALLAIEQLRWRDFTGLLGPAIALGATVHAQLGDGEAARSLLEALQPAHRDDVKVVLQVAEAEAWLAVVAEEPESAAGMLVPAVARGIELGHLLLAALTASVAVRVGASAEVREPLAAAAAASGSPLITMVSALADATAARDAAAVIALVDDLERAGLSGVAHGVLEQAAEWAAGDRMLERRARVTAAELGLTVVPVRTARSARADTGLTEREWTIAQAAARRERSREIADRLGVSVRTVDNHLASVYRKLGISGRSELEDELRGRL